MKNLPVIHHHFKFSKKLLSNPGYFKSITFESIPFFKLYAKSDLRLIRDTIDTLSCVSMPTAFQAIFTNMKPPNHIASNHYRQELIPLTYCVYNRQSFFVRCYQLRHNDFIKVEIVLHSKALGVGKYYDLKKAIKSSVSFFNRLEDNLIPLSSSLHLDEYFLCEELEKKVGVFEDELFHLKKHNSPVTRGVLKRGLKKDLLEFQENAKSHSEILRKSKKLDQYKLSKLNSINLIVAIRTNLAKLH